MMIEDVAPDLSVNAPVVGLIVRDLSGQIDAKTQRAH
jgi:hypothetical protein